nr:hypothetical protein [Tanacetum cinerariifolium]
MAKTINAEAHIHAQVDGKDIVITESSVRRDLQLADKEDEDVHKELGDSLVKAATTASSLGSEQDSAMVESSRDEESLVNDAQVSTVATVTITTKEISLAEALKALKTSKAKDKGKGIMIKEHLKPKKKDQIRLDEKAALKLQAEFDGEERLAREKAEKEARANIALIKE